MAEIYCNVCDQQLNDIYFGFFECYQTHTFCSDCIDEIQENSSKCPIDLVFNRYTVSVKSGEILQKIDCFTSLLIKYLK